MLVKDCMTRHPIMINAEALASEAQQVMVENSVRHLPVVGDGKRLQGLITRRTLSLDPQSLGSLNVWEITRFAANITVKQVMIPTKKVHTITANRTLEAAAHLLSLHKIGCLPVIEDDDVVVGIITEVDLLEAFKEMLGLPAKGMRVTVRMPNQPGEFKRLMSVFAEHNWGVMGISTYPSPRREGFYDAVIKIPGITSADIQAGFSEREEFELIDIRASEHVPT